MSRSRKSLSTYETKRDFTRTREPRSGGKSRGNLFVVQHHWARRDHYDFRLELDGVLLSWAVTRGPSLNPADKRLAVRTEDHPLAYADFEGTIPKGNYGGGTVQIWDNGTWQPQGAEQPQQSLKKGMLKFILHGHRMKGRWVLVRLKNEGRRENWLLIKERDEHARIDSSLIDKFSTSVVSKRSRRQIERDADKEAIAPGGSQTRRKKAKPLPKFVNPMLCTLEDEPPPGQGWLHETKYDGYRLQAAVDGTSVVLYTREGLDWTHRFPAIASALSKLELSKTLLDGEAVVFDRKGLTDFSALVKALKENTQNVAYVVFDLLFSNGKDLRKRLLQERKAMLASKLEKIDENILRLAPFIEASGDLIFRKAVKAGAEGIVSKSIKSTYQSRRSPNWIKTKANKREDILIVGYLPSERREFSSLLAATEVNGKLQFAGGVGTGFDRRELTSALQMLNNLRRPSPPSLLRGSEKAPRKTVWVEPKLRAEIAFQGWTADKQLRHARFLGWREDRNTSRRGRA